MNLLPQDIVVVLKLLSSRSLNKHHTYARLGQDLLLSPSQVFRSMKRAEQALLLRSPTVPPPPGFPDSSHDESQVFTWLNHNNLKEFLIHGVKYAFPVEHGGATRGMPTAAATLPLSVHLAQDFALPPVWPWAEGSVRGISFSPLYKNVPHAALRDPKLYELLALLDAIREGRAREREIAVRELSARIDSQ